MDPLHFGPTRPAHSPAATLGDFGLLPGPAPKFLPVQKEVISCHRRFFKGPSWSVGDAASIKLK